MAKIKLNGKEVEYKEYLTFAERNELLPIIEGNIENTGEKLIQVNTKLLELHLISIDGVKENLIPILYEMPAKEVDKLLKIINTKDSEEKKS